MRWLGLVGLVVAFTLLAPMPPVPAEPAADRPTLAEDGRVATVLEVQGTALVRPVGRDRWTPLSPRSLLMPGDLVRTPHRGAHAVEIEATGGGRVVLGPGGLLEWPARSAIRILRGDLALEPAADNPLRVTGPGDFLTEGNVARYLRAADGATILSPEPPRWLVGYRASTTDEWMGSLVANIDGREVPLHVGEHAMDVVIRDQIARTTVVQTFVNNTSSTLEGVFTFPLPADASISGFGMWIGDELVEADIVERGRAREIYEDIRRRRKDPGLLEWSGGNLFKASVFPIPGGSVKRIRVQYTQVLPLEGSTVRYRYALRSELLRARPLRELRVKVSVHSKTPILDVTSSTHEVRVRRTAAHAILEHQDSEVRPDRDLEVAIALDSPAPLTVVPHRRGEDGTFMLLLTPPDPDAGAWRRELTPEGDPLEVLIVADTSASMDRAQRAAQAAFVESLLSLLGEKDRFRLLVADVAVHEYRPNPAPGKDAEVRAAMKFLTDRRSLGWTDLDLALESALRLAGPATHVIYVGDGIETSGDTDPAAVADGLSRLGETTGARVHAVSTGAAYEAGVLATMAAIGGGSVREIRGDPAGTAARLLAEATRPPVKDLALTIDGIPTARVYPERLPDLAAGRQQTILGRFLPGTGGTSSGRVTVTGTLDGKPVRYSAPIRIDEEETGNSFLPRLWARRHLDALLAEGRTAAVVDEIVGMSAEYGIMTPYTSFLVLENDEDRARYGVERRVRMRDGERFFATAKDSARAAILREQMQIARTWRRRLRARMRNEIAGLGRDLIRRGVAYGHPIGIGGGAGRPWGGRQSSRPGVRDLEFLADRVADGDDREPTVKDVPFGEVAPPADSGASGEDRPPSDMPARFDRSQLRAEGGGAGGSMAHKPVSLPGPYTPAMSRLSRTLDGPFDVGRRVWLVQHGFPGITERPARAEPTAPPSWSKEIVDLLAPLNRRPALGALTSGLEIEIRSVNYAPRGTAVTDRNSARLLVSPEAWSVTRVRRGADPQLEWLADDVRGALGLGLRLGRKRPAKPVDRAFWRVAYELGGEDQLGGSADRTASIEKREGDLVTIRLTWPGEARNSTVLVVDESRHVVLERRSYQGGKLTWRIVQDGFVEAGGLWWPTRSRSFRPDGELTWSTTWTIRSRTADDVVAAIRAETATHGDAIFAGAADPDPIEARRAVLENRADLAQRLTVLLEQAARQEWDRAFDSLAEFQAAAGDRPGATWIGLSLLAQGRRGEKAKDLAMALAPGIAARTDPAAPFLARWLYTTVRTVLGPHERLALLDILAPAPKTGPDADAGDLQWSRDRADALAAAGRKKEARALWRRIAEEHRSDPLAIRHHAAALLAADEVDAAVAFFAEAVAGDHGGSAHDRDNLHAWWAGELRRLRRFEDLLPALERWIASSPVNERPYSHRLTTLYDLERSDEADAWILQQVETAPGEPGDRVWPAKLGAALGALLGDRWYAWNRPRSTPDIALAKPVGELALRLTRHEEGWNLARRILGNGWFSGSDAAVVLRARILEDLAAPGAVETMSLGRLTGTVYGLAWHVPAAGHDRWRSIVDRVRRRFTDADDAEEWRRLAPLLLRLLDARGAAEEAIVFSREWLDVASGAERVAVVRQLMGRLAARPWTPEIENEMLTLRPGLVVPEAADPDRRGVAAGAVRWLVERLLPMRVEAALGPAEIRERWPRAELRRREREARLAARRGLARRFGEEVARTDDAARPWFEIERLGLAVEVGDDLPAIEGAARELLLGATDDEKTVLREILRERARLVLAFAACRSNATEDLVARVVALHRDELRGEDGARRYALFRLLVALDRPEELERALRAWILPGKVESRWRIALGYLLAETGRLREAAAEFEIVAGHEQLPEDGLVALAAWYAVLGDEAGRETALVRRWAMLGEHELQRRLRQHVYALRSARRGEVPPEVDPEVFPLLRALLTKAKHPAHHIRSTIDLYRNTKDFRALESLADGIVGHSPVGVYTFLSQVTDVVLKMVHEEATLDEITRRIEVRRGAVETDTDRRGLLLLEALVERRSAEALHQSGPHGERAVSALARAFPTMWNPGERRLLASFLARIGKVPHEAFASEQLRQLRTLHRIEEKGTLDRLRIAHSLGSALYSYGEIDEAIDRVAAALDEYRAARDGTLPTSVWNVVQSLVAWLEEKGHFLRGESFLVRERERQPTAERRRWYTLRLHQLYVLCLERKGRVAAGTGKDLYAFARPLLLRALVELDRPRVGATVRQLGLLHRSAVKTAEIATAAEDLVAFSRRELPAALRRTPNEEPALIGMIVQTIHDVVGRVPAMTFLVERLEASAEVDAARRSNLWNTCASLLGTWRRKDPDLGELEDRLLVVVLRELRRDLVSQQMRSRHLYSRRYPGLWKEKADVFAATARCVLLERSDSPAAIHYVARYLWGDLRLRTEAAEVLLAAGDRDLLTERSRSDLADWLQSLDRHEEARPHLDRLVRDKPDVVPYRTRYVDLLHRTGREIMGRALLESTVARLRAQRRLDANPLVTLGGTGLRCGYHRPALALYREGTALLSRTSHAAGSGRGDHRLASAYTGLASCLVALGRTTEALDAATAAAVVRPRGGDQAVRQVLGRADDLDAVVAAWEARVKETGFDAAIVRAGLGRALLSRREPARAAAQYAHARDLRPEDPDIHEGLVDALHRADDEEGACAARLASIEFTDARRRSRAVTDLIRRFERLGRMGQAERARTTLVEHEPNAAEGHRVLARSLAVARRFEEACARWRVVLRLDAKNSRDWFELADALIRAGDRDEARSVLARMLEEDWGRRADHVRRRADRLLRAIPPR